MELNTYLTIIQDYLKDKNPNDVIACFVTQKTQEKFEASLIAYNVKYSDLKHIKLDEGKVNWLSQKTKDLIKNTYVDRFATELVLYEGDLPEWNS